MKSTLVRDAEMIGLYLSGATMADLATDFGLTAARIWQILHRELTPAELAECTFRNRSRAASRARPGLSAILRKRWAERTFWTAERLRELAQYRRDGLSFGQIAERMGVSRNAIAGRLFRNAHA